MPNPKIQDPAASALAFLERAVGPAIATDQDDRILGWNGAARRMLGYGDGESVTGRSFRDLLQARDIFGNRIGAEPIAFWEMVTIGESVRTFEIRVRRASGGLLLVAASVMVFVGPEPDRYQLVYLMRPILRRRRTDEAIERILSHPRAGELLPEARQDEEVPGPELSPRQVEVLQLLAQGSGAHEIARVLGVSVETARRHIGEILEEMGAENQVAAVARALRERLI